MNRYNIFGEDFDGVLHSFDVNAEYDLRVCSVNLPVQLADFRIYRLNDKNKITAILYHGKTIRPPSVEAEKRLAEIEKEKLKSKSHVILES